MTRKHEPIAVNDYAVAAEQAVAAAGGQYDTAAIARDLISHSDGRTIPPGELPESLFWRIVASHELPDDGR